MQLLQLWEDWRSENLSRKVREIVVKIYIPAWIFDMLTQEDDLVAIGLEKQQNQQYNLMMPFSFPGLSQLHLLPSSTCVAPATSLLSFLNSISAGFARSDCSLTIQSNIQNSICFHPYSIVLHFIYLIYIKLTYKDKHLLGSCLCLKLIGQSYIFLLLDFTDNQDFLATVRNEVCKWDCLFLLEWTENLLYLGVRQIFMCKAVYEGSN